MFLRYDLRGATRRHRALQGESPRTVAGAPQASIAAARAGAGGAISAAGATATLTLASSLAGLAREAAASALKIDTLVAAALLALGTVLAAWYTLTGAAVTLGALSRRHLGAARWGAPLARRLAAGLTAATFAATPALAASSEVPSGEPSGLTWQAKPPPAPATVQVQAGDCLWNIARGQLHPDASPREIAHATRALIHANPAVQTNPDLIRPGQVLRLPAKLP